MNSYEDLKIYKAYMDLIYYTENIVIKYPKIEKNALVSNIKNTTYEGIKLVICAQKEFNKTSRLKYLSNLDINLKMLKVYIRISYKDKYISTGNYEAWCRKIRSVSLMLGAWIKSCLKQ